MNCKELYFDGSTIHVNDATSAEVKFKRRINLKFVDDVTGDSIDNVSIKESTSNSYNVKNWIEVDENCQQATISIKATGYHDQNNINIGSGEIIAGSKTIKLKVKSDSIPITIYLPNGTPAHINVNLKHTNPLYKYIHDNGSVLYMEQDRRRNHPTTDNHPIPLWQRILKNPWTWIISALAALLILGYWFWPFGEEDEPKQVEEEEYVQKDDTTTNEDDLQADLEYLKNHDDCWDKTQLKTDEYQKLVDYIAQGQIEEAFNHPYKDKVNVNTLWKGSNGCVDIYEEIRGRVPDDDIKGALQRSRVQYNNDQVSVRNLNIELRTMKNRLNSKEEANSFSTPTQSSQTTNRQNSSSTNHSPTSNTNVTNGSSGNNSSNNGNNTSNSDKNNSGRHRAG